MKFFSFDDIDTRRDRSAYMRTYYLRYRKRSVRKKPIMNEEERRAAQRAAEKRFHEKHKKKETV